MQWLSGGRWAVALMLVVLLAGSQELRAQLGAPERVRFDTFDGVTLRGMFYPSSKGTKAACVLLLHQIGGNSAQEGWGSLAKSLQEKGYAVLAFDFRGHGDSTEVDPKLFWNTGQNSKMKGFNPGKPRTQINYKEFTLPFHYLTMVNDIAAAKRHLDSRNDSSECNSANIILIGAESGAALGALWMATEWYVDNSNPRAPSIGKGKGGRDITCAVWLSISPNLGSAFKAPVESWLRVPSIKEKTPMYFLYGKQDTKSDLYSQNLLNQALRYNTEKKKVNRFTGPRDVEGTKLAGRDLLTKTLKTQDMILKYLEEVIGDSPLNTYGKREASKELHGVRYDLLPK